MAKEFKRIEKVTQIVIAKPIAAVVFGLYFVALTAVVKGKEWLQRWRSSSQAANAASG